MTLKVSMARLRPIWRTAADRVKSEAIVRQLRYYGLETVDT